jgi:hypothetical protein
MPFKIRNRFTWLTLYDFEGVTSWSLVICRETKYELSSKSKGIRFGIRFGIKIRTDKN